MECHEKQVFFPQFLSCGNFQEDSLNIGLNTQGFSLMQWEGFWGILVGKRELIVSSLKINKFLSGAQNFRGSKNFGREEPLNPNYKYSGPEYLSCGPFEDWAEYSEVLTHAVWGVLG